MTSPGAAPAKKAKGSPARVPAAWNSLATHKKEIERTHLRDLFAKDLGRADRFRLHAAGLLLCSTKRNDAATRPAKAPTAMERAASATRLREPCVSSLRGLGFSAIGASKTVQSQR